MTTCSVLRCSSDASTAFTVDDPLWQQRIEFPVCKPHDSELATRMDWRWDLNGGRIYLDAEDLAGLHEDVVKEMKMSRSLDLGESTSLTFTAVRRGSSDERETTFILSPLQVERLREMLPDQG